MVEFAFLCTKHGLKGELVVERMGSVTDQHSIILFDSLPMKFAHTIQRPVNDWNHW